MTEPNIDEIPGHDPQLAAALAQAGLPTDDLAEACRRFFRFSERGELVGFIGWESVDETTALVRSLVVVPARRGTGAGRAMVAWALTRLVQTGVIDAYALTTTAEAFSLACGFVRVERAAAPPAVRNSRQFAGLCPLTAVLLYKSLS